MNKKLKMSIASMAIAIGGSATVSAYDGEIPMQINEDIDAARAAIDDGNYRDASLYLNTAAQNASRLELQRIAQQIAARAPLFQTQSVQYALSDSATLTFEGFLKDRNTLERRFIDDEGQVVTVRVFGEGRDLDAFVKAAGDRSMLEKEGLEVVEMAGAPAIKNRKNDRGLAVLMMSENDQALVEIVGENEDGVMAFIEQIESTAQ